MTVFFDTNILIYTITADARGGVARSRLGDGGVVSTQVLNEFVRIARKKLRLDWLIVEFALIEVRAALDDVRPVALSTPRSPGATVSTFTTRLSSPRRSRLGARRSTARISSTAGGSAT